MIASIAACGMNAWDSPTRPVNPIEAASSRIRIVGKEYPRGLATAYADAWIDGAEALESGQSVPEALGVVEKAWKAGRTSLFEERLSPCFSAIVPEGRPDGETSAFDRAALAVLWREFAAGLASGD
ncbi:hypothetical protein [Paludisphaera sp.]|uniref:hypothetical protein n=1 Tax=Paludisphaera sp. TaxID=2017432 RepID=UPI00301D05F8